MSPDCLETFSGYSVSSCESQKCAILSIKFDPVKKNCVNSSLEIVRKLSCASPASLRSALF